MATLEVDYKGQKVILEGSSESVMAAMEAFSVATALEDNIQRQNKLRLEHVSNVRSVDPTKIDFTA